MKKPLTLLLAGTLVVGNLFFCIPAREVNASEAKPLSIVTTIFPEYDWVMNILGDNPGGATVEMLLDTGVDLHSFQPSVNDIVAIGESDLFIYVGGESDGWVEAALAQCGDKMPTVVNLMEVLGDSAKVEELKEGMEGHDHDHDEEDHDHEEEDHDHEEEDHDHEEEHDHDHEEGEAEYDEHIWLSLKNAQLIVQCLAQTMAELDEANASTYQSNAQAYEQLLADLDAQYQEAVDQAQYKTLLFGDRFPFRYLVDDYGLDYYAAFMGCSAETEASFETVIFLAGKVDELSLPVILTIEGTDHRLAETILSNTKSQDQEILSVDSLQSTTAVQVEEGKTYLDTMTANLEIFKAALGA